MGLLKLLSILVVAGCAWWTYSDLRKKGFGLGISGVAGVGSPLLAFLLSDWVIALLLGPDLATLAAAGVTLAFTAGFSRPLIKQLRSAPRRLK